MPSPDAPTGYFEPLARSPQCAACNDQRATPRLADAIYCISLQEEDDRAREAAAHFHAIGLCRHVTFYRPRRRGNLDGGVWTSHRDVARHALAQNHQSVLVLEDDVQFFTDWPDVSRRAARAMAKLPDGWWGFYLGHWPVQAYFVAWDVLRARSACGHAYIANRPLIEWIARTRSLDATVPVLWPGASIDTAIGNLPEMYALFPMGATQRPPAHYRRSRSVNADGSRIKWFSFNRHRYWIIHHAMRPAEIVAALASPVHWLTMRLRGIGLGQSGRVETALSRRAALIRNAGLFDEAHYVAHCPELDPDTVDPLRHYMTHGDGEGRTPHPLFDTAYYRRAAGPGVSDNAVIHYLRAEPGARKDPHPCFDGAWYLAQMPENAAAGRAPLVHYLNAEPGARKSPHPCFDEAWYLAQYPDVAASGEPGLVHYVTRGWKEGRWPHPAFDTRRYLTENPDVAAAGVNPLDHYIRHGQSEGRARWFIR